MVKEKQLSLRIDQRINNIINDYASETGKSKSDAAKELIKYGYDAIHNNQVICDDLKREYFNAYGELQAIDTFFETQNIVYPNQKNLNNCTDAMERRFILWKK